MFDVSVEVDTRCPIDVRLRVRQSNLLFRDKTAVGWHHFSQHRISIGCVKSSLVCFCLGIFLLSNLCLSFYELWYVLEESSVWVIENGFDLAEFLFDLENYIVYPRLRMVSSYRLRSLPNGGALMEPTSVARFQVTS